MLGVKLSDSFIFNIKFWTVFAIWPGEKWNLIYSSYSTVVLGFLLIFYNIFLTISLFCAPKRIEVLLSEGVLYFTEIAVAAKVYMIVGKRYKILHMYDILDSDLFSSEDRVGEKMRQQSKNYYIFGWKAYLVVCHMAYIFLVFSNIFVHVVLGEHLNLPISNYYFLSDETREKYMYPLYFYQSLGMFSHMTFNVNIDTYVWGVMYFAVSQFDLLQYKIRQIKKKVILKNDTTIEDNKNLLQLKHCLKHYDLLLKYCALCEDVISFSLFVQFSMSSIIMCVVLGGLVLTEPPVGTILFTCFYLTAMIAEIFIPCWMGSDIINKSQEIVSAAYDSDWLEQSLSFKKSINLFSERANTPILLNAFKIFPISLTTFTAIMKTTYSLFTMVRHVQDKQTIN